MSTQDEFQIFNSGNFQISDEEIRRRLINDFNIDCGPVTSQTRRILLKKLIKLEQERNGSDFNIVNVNNNEISNLNDIEEHSITNGGEDSRGEINGSGEDFSQINFETNETQMNRKSPRKYSPRYKCSEEEEAIKSFKEVEKTLKQPESIKKNKSTKIDLISQPSTIRLNEFSCSDSSDNEDVIIPELPINALNSSKISGITSPRVSTKTHTYRPSGLTRAPIRRTTIFDIKKSPSLLTYSDSESDSEHSKKDKICKILLKHRPGLGRAKNHRKRSKFISFFQNLKQKFISPNRNESMTTTNFSTSSNYISLGLLIFVIIFFFVIFSIYFYSRFTYTSKHSLDLTDYTFIEDKSKLMAPICEGNITIKCIPYESDRKPALNIIKEIKNYIDKHIYESYCESPISSIPEIESFLFKQSDFQKEIQSNYYTNISSRHPELKNMTDIQLFFYDLSNAFKLIQLNSAWNLKVVDNFMSEISLASNYSINLPIQCRLKLFWKSNFWFIISTIATIIMSTVFFFYYRYTKHLEIQEQEQVYEMIEKSLGLLQSPDEPQSMPVLHIRDALLTPADKKNSKYKRIWNKVVNHIENSESRVKVEYKKIDGEEFKAWKWIASTNSQYITDSESDVEYLGSASSQTQKIGGVEWQGQAFVFSNNKPNTVLKNEPLENLFQSDLNRNKNFQALTRFLKIRNIFEKEAQYVDSTWSKKIKNTILEKTANTSETGQHDIVHIEIDDSTNEGLVFLKCGSMAGATNAFHALHGWWCEKKLVSVKFLKEERYYQRFPHSRFMNTPLKITSIE